MKLRAHARTAAFLVAVYLLSSMAISVPIEAQENYDVVIANGRVTDPESGLNAVRNIGIMAGKIRAISIAPLHGKSMIDAKGLVVAPGFMICTNTGRRLKHTGIRPTTA